jgi:hypothetical protein
MSFKNTRIIESPLNVATPEEVQSVAASLKVLFPDGYQDYVTTLGHGDYCGYVRVYMPSSVLAEYKTWQNLWREYFFWEEEPEVLNKDRVVESIAIADTIDGDMVVFHPSNSTELFVLPRHDDYIYKIGSNLYEALDWLCESEVLVKKIKSRFFVPQSWLVQNDYNIPFIEDGWEIPDDF